MTSRISEFSHFHEKCAMLSFVTGKGEIANNICFGKGSVNVRDLDFPLGENQVRENFARAGNRKNRKTHEVVCFRGPFSHFHSRFLISKTVKTRKSTNYYSNAFRCRKLVLPGAAKNRQESSKSIWSMYLHAIFTFSVASGRPSKNENGRQIDSPNRCWSIFMILGRAKNPGRF